MISRIEQLCKEKGLKITGQRRVIAQVLSDSDDHPDAQELHRRAVSIDPRISMATVYRTVRLFKDAKIIEHHDFGGGRARYESTSDTDGHHHHIINMLTGEVIEFEDSPLETIKRRIAADMGYEIVGDRLELYCVPIDEDKG